MKWCASNPSNPNGERRQNGKLKLTATDYIKVLFTLIIVVGVGATAWATLRGNVSAIAKEAEASTKSNTTQDKRLDIVETKQTEIHENVKEVMLKQDTIQQLLYRIDGKLERNGEYQ